MLYCKFINIFYDLTLTTATFFITNDDFPKEYYSERAPTDPMKINAQFTNKLESVHYNSALAITGCVRGTSKEKLFTELGLSSLYDRRQFHRLSLYYKIINGLTPAYLKCHVPNPAFNLYNVRYSVPVPLNSDIAFSQTASIRGTT